MQVFQGNFEELQAAVDCCTRCRLCEGRTHAALGEGNVHADIMLIGEGPGQEEDLQGRPFVGPAGQLLDKMIAAIGMERGQLYIANIVKCRPPGNRNPLDDEQDACLPYLRRQFQLIQPKIIVCLGAVAAKRIWGPEIRITKDHGKWKRNRDLLILPTFHPAALLRDPAKKRDAWEDWKSLLDQYQNII